MKKIFLFLILVISSSRLVAQSNKDAFLTRPLTKENIQKIYAKTTGGNIEATGISTGESRLEVYVSANNFKDNLSLSKEEIQKRMNEDYDLNISVSNNQLDVIAEKKSFFDWKQSLNISFKLFVRSNVSTDLHTSGGSIRLSNLSGDQSFSTSGGNLDLDKLSGKIVGETSGGNIRITNSQNDIHLETSGGNIEATNCKGNIKLFTSGGSFNLNNLSGNIESRTSGGSIHATNISGELFSTHTSGGGIELLEMSCSIDASTSGGGIGVKSNQLGKYLKLSSSGGSIDLQIPGSQGLNLNLNAPKVNVNVLHNFSGTKEEDVIKGTLNGGGTPIDAEASGGNISVKFR